ncbi:MAG TPA: ATP-grasp domain-containing protein [Pyrinomonadaceae bacterium]|nr:ATP-grasp domain-containing protein [Pyrinomonadaceae bacterium]
MKVLVLHTLPPEAIADGRNSWEFDLSEAVEGIAEVLPEAILAGVRGEAREILLLLSEHQPDVVFNACEAPLGRPNLEAHVAALLEWLDVRFTGSGSETLALCRRKDRVNAVLEAAQVPVPRKSLFPCIVKPAGEDGSVGIYADSVCENLEALQRARARFDVPVVVEEFLPGREFAVSLWGREEPEHSSIGETRFKGELRLNTYAAKWDIESVDFANSPMFYDIELDTSLRESVIEAARGAWRAVEARGYIRVDVRLDSDHVPRVIDVNPNPELSPGVGIHRAALEAGWSWQKFVRRQIEWA